MDTPSRQYWEDYAQNLNYMNRWAIQKTDLPDSVKSRVMGFFNQNPDLKRIYLPMLEALEKNQPAIIMEDV